jgi:hypothetical protein
MKELGELFLIIICVSLVASFLIFCVDWINEYFHDNDCRNNGHPDAVHIKTQGWYCVGIQDNEPYLVKFEDVVNGD